METAYEGIDAAGNSYSVPYTDLTLGIGPDGTVTPVKAEATAGAVALTATIAVSASASDAQAIDGRLVGGFYIPVSFEGGYLQFERSLNGTTGWSPVKDGISGTALRYVAASSTFVNAAALDFIGVEYLRVISTDVSGTPVNQSGTSATVSIALG